MKDADRRGLVPYCPICDGREARVTFLTQCRVGAVLLRVEQPAAHALALIREGERIFADETTLPTLNPGAGKTRTSWLWAHARDDRPFGGSGPPMVAYREEDIRAGDCAAHCLGDCRGILQCDGYAGYGKLAGAPHSNGLHLAGCWAQPPSNCKASNDIGRRAFLLAGARLKKRFSI